MHAKIVLRRGRKTRNLFTPHLAIERESTNNTVYVEQTINYVFRTKTEPPLEHENSRKITSEGIVGQRPAAAEVVILKPQ